MRSGLVQLMDRLCSLSSQRECSSNEKQTKKQKVAAMAWAAFQVLANRCIEWEKVESEQHASAPTHAPPTDEHFSTQHTHTHMCSYL